MVAVRLRAPDGTESVQLAESIGPCPLLSDNVLLRGIQGVVEEAFPRLVVRDWSIRRSVVVSYSVGDMLPLRMSVPGGWEPGGPEAPGLSPGVETSTPGAPVGMNTPVQGGTGEKGRRRERR